MANRPKNVCHLVNKDEHCENCAMRQLSVCSALSEEAFEIIRDAATVSTYQKGSTIVEQGDDFDHVYFVSEGLIELYRIFADGQRRITGFLGPGDLLSGVKSRDGAYCTARTITEVRVCAFPRKMFVDMMLNHSQLSYAMLLTATDEIEAQNDHIVLLGRNRTIERLAAFLLIFSHRWAVKEGHSDQVINLPMPRSDIADYLGLTIESVSRGFTTFKNAGLISLPARDKVSLDNLPALFEIAKMDDFPSKRTGFGL